MNILYSVSEFVTNHGYIGIFIATALEYACFPVSSEILFPFIGYCAARGGLNIVLSVFISTLAAIAGCSFCYLMGRFGQKLLAITLFKIFPKTKLAVDNASSWFIKKGSMSVLFGRLFPLVRTYISFPAGIAKMNYIKFISLTYAGAALWNTALISSGYLLGEHWEEAKIIIKSPFFIICSGIVLIMFPIKKLFKKFHASKSNFS